MPFINAFYIHFELFFVVAGCCCSCNYYFVFVLVLFGVDVFGDSIIDNCMANLCWKMEWPVCDEQCYIGI